MSTKSLANEITNRAIAGVPAATDLLLFAPLPNTPLVTQAKKCTVADLMSGLGLAIPANEVVFGTGPGISSSPVLIFNGKTLSIFADSTGNGYTAGDFFAGHSSGAAAGILGGLKGVAELDAGSLSAVRAGRFESLVFGGTVTETTGLDVFIDNSGGVVSESRGLRIADVTGATMINRAIETGLGACVFGDTIQAQGYKSSDGTAGETAVILAAGLVSITVKNGLVVAHA